MAVTQQQPYSPQQDQSQQLAQAGVQPGGLFGTASGPSLAGGAGGVDFGTVFQKLVSGVFGTAPTQFGRQAPNIPPIQPKQQVPQMQTSEQVFPPGGGSANKRIAMNNMFKNAQAVVQTIDRNIEQKNIREMQVHFDRLFTAMNGVTEAQQVLKDQNSSPQMKQQAQQALQQNSGVVATMTDPNTPLGKKVHKELKNALDFNFVGEDKGADSVGRKAYQGVLQQQKQAVGNANLNFNKPGVSAAQQGPQAIQQQQQQAGQQRIQQLQQMMPQVLQQNPQWLAALGMLKAMKEGGITDLYKQQLENKGKIDVEAIKESGAWDRAMLNDQTRMMIAKGLARLGQEKIDAMFKIAREHGATEKDIEHMRIGAQREKMYLGFASGIIRDNSGNSRTLTAEQKLQGDMLYKQSEALDKDFKEFDNQLLTTQSMVAGLKGQSKKNPDGHWQVTMDLTMSDSDKQQLKNLERQLNFYEDKKNEVDKQQKKVIDKMGQLTGTNSMPTETIPTQGGDAFLPSHGDDARRQQEHQAEQQRLSDEFNKSLEALRDVAVSP